MAQIIDKEDEEAREIAEKWCKSKGAGWEVKEQLGRGGTAPVFEIKCPDGGLRALKIYDGAFSSGNKGDIERQRISQQLSLKDHDCPSLVQIYDGGDFEERLFVLMSRAPGNELERRLDDIPRNKIRLIVDQIAKATIFLRDKNICHRDIKSANIFISKDFNEATLLDISVIRGIYDPVGVGTDHNGQLPVLATARYSPPEYLFRLIEPGDKLWHALNIYQLGALLHDLIMRKPMFQEEFLLSKENRYRFAWVVATIEPEIAVDDVDQDLLFLAKRALDKDWERRSSIQIEEFLAGNSSQRSHLLRLIGLVEEPSNDDHIVDKRPLRRRIQEVASELEDAVTGRLRDKGITATHKRPRLSNDTEKMLAFEWNAPSQINDSNDDIKIKFDLIVSLDDRSGKIFFRIMAKLSRHENGYSKDVSMELPSVEDKEHIVATLVSDVFTALGNLAVKLSKQGNE